MWKPKKAIPYLAAGLAIGGCGDEQSQQDRRSGAIEAFCLKLETCYPEFELPPGACQAYYSAYLDSLVLVHNNPAECIAAWETALQCFASASCGETDACFEEDENGDDLLDRACP